VADDEQMDAADAAWLATMIPEGCVSQGFISVVVFFDGEGEMKYKVYSQMEAPLTSCLGLLELAKMDMIARTPGTWFEPCNEEN
jgi:hypothetical protein